MPMSRSLSVAAIAMMLMASLPAPSAESADAAAAVLGRALAAPRVEPARDYLSSAELLSQDLTVYLDPENRSMAVEGSLCLRANIDLARLTMYLHETLDLLNITENGQPLLYTRNVERLTIDLSARLAANATTNLSFYYNGTMWYLENGARQDCVGWEGAYVKGSTFWYLRHHASDWADYRLKLCCPPNWTAIADGELVAEEHTAGWANYTWANDLPCLRPAFAAGNYTVASRAGGGTQLSAYTYPQHAGIAAAYLDEAANVFDFYLGILGPYGRRSFKIVETAHQTMSGYACSGFVMLYPAAFTQGAVKYNLLAHESGHMWFPYATGYQGWAYPWLWEAFPEYLSCLYEMKYHGVQTRLDYDYGEYVRVHALSDIRSISASDWDTPYSSQIVYAKGAWVLRMLQGIVGTAAFGAILAEYIDKNLWAYGSAGAFVATAARHSPVKLDDFWEQWLNTTKALDVSLPAARQYENGTGFCLELEPANLLEASNPADVLVEYTDGRSEILRRGWDGKAKPVVLELPSSVKQVRLDPDGWLLDVDRGNQAAVPAPSGKMFELHPREPSFPAGPVEGTETAITAGVHNDGWHDARGVVVDFLVDGCRTGRKLIDIPAQGESEATASWLPRQGRHNITVSVDSEDGFHEWNEGNNNASIAIDVAPPPPRPDVWLGNLSIGEILVEGQQYSINVTVRNAGDVALDLVMVEYRLDGKALGQRLARFLPVGAETGLSLDWTATRGYHNLSVRADPEGQIREVDEGNNIENRFLFVTWMDEFAIDVAPQKPRTLEPVTFSVEGDAEEFHYEWDDGTIVPWTAERVVVHTFARGGLHTLAVHGRAGGHQVGGALVDIAVSNRPPEVSAHHDPPSPLSLSIVIFTARTLDLDGTVGPVLWDFGDGTKGNGSRAGHSFARPGNYTVRCTAFDDRGGEGTTSLLVPVGNRPPLIGWTGLAWVFVGKRLDLAANASDPDGHVGSCRWQFGDGSSADGENVSHAYSKPGTYLVTVTVWDELGACANLTGSVEVKARRTAGPAGPAWMWLLVPAIAAVAVAAWFVQSRRRLSRQRDDFFRPPPREGQNP